MGPKSPIHPHPSPSAMGCGWGIGWAFPGDVVVPSSSRESANSRGPRGRQHVILGRLGRFLFRNLVLKPCEHTIGSRASSSVRSGQFFSTWCKYHPKLHGSDYIPSTVVDDGRLGAGRRTSSRLHGRGRPRRGASLSARLSEPAGTDQLRNVERSTVLLSDFLRYRSDLLSTTRCTAFCYIADSTGF